MAHLKSHECKASHAEDPVSMATLASLVLRQLAEKTPDQVEPDSVAEACNGCEREKTGFLASPRKLEMSTMSSVMVMNEGAASDVAIGR